MIRTAGIFLYVGVATAFMGLLAILSSFFSRTGDAVHKAVARNWARSILSVSGIRVHVAGLEKLDPGGAYVFMANHQSAFDIPVLLAHVPFQFRWIAKTELFRIPIFGRAMRGAGYIPINRSDRSAAFQSLEEAARRMREGRSIMMFPEGTRSRDGRLQPFKKGGFMLAIASGMPIVPVALDGTFEIMPKGRLRIRQREVAMRFGAPLASTEFSRETKEALMDQVRRALLAELKQDEGA